MKNRLIAKDATGYSAVNRYLVLAWVALIGFPLFGCLWTYLIPQPYESPILRTFGVLVVMPLFYARRFHQQTWFVNYFKIAVTFCLPIFFFYMYLMNGANIAWAESLLLVVMLLLYVDNYPSCWSLFVGIGLATVGFLLKAGVDAWPGNNIVQSLPIAVMVLGVMKVLSVRNQMQSDAASERMSSAIRSFAHELRTPLLAVQANARGLSRYIPQLLESFMNTRTGDVQSASHLSKMQALPLSVDRITLSVLVMNASIDLFVANATLLDLDVRSVENVSVRSLVEETINVYPFLSDQQRDKVHFQCTKDFIFSANLVLVRMVIFNLVKNGLHAIARKNDGQISIISTSEGPDNYLIFRDTGCGIPAEHIPIIFDRFFTYPASANTGLGLAFCQKVLNAWGASIECTSVLGEGTEFKIRFSASP